MNNEKYKTVVKVFTIITLIFTFWLIYPLIIGIITLKKIESPDMSDGDKLTYGLLNLLFVNIISGIFLLIDRK